MYNTYISSAITFRTKGSVCYSSTDYRYLLNNNRVNTTTSPCTCCVFPFTGVPLNPRYTFFYGLLQSRLIQCSASKRLILGGGGRFFQLPICDFDRVCYGDTCNIKTSCQCNCTSTSSCDPCNDFKESCHCSSTSRRRRGKERRFKCVVWEENSESCDSDEDGTMEAMLGLLTEENNQKSYGGRERNSRLLGGKVQAERRGISDYRKREKYAESDCVERNSKGTFESVIKSRKEDCRLSGRREGSLRRGNCQLRKDGSSCSSYYSVLSSDEIDESDVDVQVNDRKFSGESLSRNKKELRRGKEEISVKNVIKQSKNNKDDSVGYREDSTQGNAATGLTAVVVGSDYHSKNEREKKLTDISILPGVSRIESGNDHSNVVASHKVAAEMTSVPHKRFRGRRDHSGSSTYSVHDTREQHSQQDESRRKSQHLTETSQIQDSGIEWASSSQTRLRRREENLAASVNLLQEQRERHSQTGQSFGQNESRRKSQQLSGMLESHDTDIRSTFISQQQHESTLKNREGSSISSFQEEEDQSQSAERVVWETKSTKDYLDLTNISSTTTVSDMTIVNDSQKLFERRTSPQEEYSASHVDLTQEARHSKIRQASEHAIIQLGSVKESERLTEISSFRENSANKASSSQPSNFAQQKSEKQMDERKESGRNSQIMVTPPPSQIVHRTSCETVRYRKPSSGNATGEVDSEMPGSGSSTLYSQAFTPSSSAEVDGRIRKGKSYEDQSKVMFHEDALGSANRLEESSTQFVRQFVENLSHEISTSKLWEENMSSQTTSIDKDEEYIQQTLNQQVPDDVHSQVHDSRRSSSRSGARGPSYEMWDVAAPVVEESARSDAPGEVNPTTKSAIVRSGRSLWSIIGDIVRLRWGARSETQNLTKKAGGKSSPDESVGTGSASEAWFSSHEADEKDDENVKKGRRSMPKVHESSDHPSLLIAGTETLGGASERMSLNTKILQIDAGTFSNLDTLEGSSASQAASLASKEERISRKLDERSSQGIPSTTSTASSSSLPSRHLMRSPAVKGEVPESSKVVVSGIGLVQMKEPVREGPTESSGSEVKDGELKRGKFQRKKQVGKETFEEWEQAYQLESEQRKMDEMFMKEALLEAKRAADTWEVPVGAVLVQHGKIIARGCNLVEDLRDSTAHAEMICIREASKILRTWRLADTTLYVTLEPCAMCAGAILQARIDTVVWGAPNKLLGADGSWVRLFPGGVEVGASSDHTSQPAGPVHPFHKKIAIRRGILATECADAMQQFFQLRRRSDKKLDSPPTSSLPVSTHPSKFLSKMHDIFAIMFCL